MSHYHHITIDEQKKILLLHAKKLLFEMRHRGKTRRTKGTVKTRGKMKISNTIYLRPIEVDNCLELGYWRQIL